MASEEHQAADAPAGDAPSRGRSWSGRRTAAAVAVAVGVAAAGGAAIAAGTGGGAAAVGNVAFTSDPGYGQGGTGQEGQEGKGGRPGGHRGPGGMGPGLGDALHGEFVVADGSGGYVTRLMQSGKVTAVDSGSITVASDDSYSKTYSITSSTTVRGAESAAAIPVDTVVTVVADQGGAALSIGHRPAKPEGGPGGPGGHPRGGAPGERAPGEPAPGEGTPPAPSPTPDSGTPTEPSPPQPTT